MRGLNYFRRGTRRDNGQPCVHLVDSQCKSHRLVVRSSYGAETLAAAHGVEEALPTLVTLHELRKGVMTAAQLKSFRERGGLEVEATLTVDAESVYKSLTSRDCKVPTEKTLLGHVAWLRELLKKNTLSYVQWCDTRDMTSDGHQGMHRQIPTLGSHEWTTRVQACCEEACTAPQWQGRVN